MRRGYCSSAVTLATFLILFISVSTPTVTSLSTGISMVEGHSVHRVAALHRKRLVGKSFKAWSPNGRFTDGAKAIDGKNFSRIEAVGKNLFCFFGNTSYAKKKEDPVVVVHVHFGMAGNWAVYQGKDAIEEAPEPTKTNRLRLENTEYDLLADLSAMTVQHGGMELYDEKRAKLGEDPLRDDADPERLWNKVQQSKKSIGALIMDQSYFTGPGNIYRAEILFKAGVHPDIPGKEIERADFDKIWRHTVQLLQRGYETGSILTVDPEEAIALNRPTLRRYIYNSAKCPRCNTAIRTWDIANRKCYACPTCQPRQQQTKISPLAVVTPEKEECVPFNSHCARESMEDRLRASGPARLTVAEIKIQLAKHAGTAVKVPPKANKAVLVKMLEAALEKKPAFVSSEEAAAEKAAAGESLAVEHIAELGPSQARKARKKVFPVEVKQEDALIKQEDALIKQEDALIKQEDAHDVKSQIENMDGRRVTRSRTKRTVPLADENRAKKRSKD